MSRMLFLTRGVAGCGKSTFIQENGLEHLTISSDKIRLMMSSPVHDQDGHPNIDQRRMKEAWEWIYKFLEMRFQNGATTILDATNLKEKDVRPIRNIARDYRYRVYAIDFTDIPDAEIYRRNANRNELARVPEHVIARMLNIAKNEKVPGGVSVVSREEALKLLKNPYETTISDSIKAINVIGDVHGCASALSQLMHNICDFADTISITAPVGRTFPYEKKTIEFPLPRKDEKYIFCGDYLDRGLENVHVIKYLKYIIDNDYDVVLLEGNHEKWIKHWATENNSYRNADFASYTRKQLEASDFTRKDASQFYSKLSQYIFLKTAFKGQPKTPIFITHGGISYFPDLFADLSTKEMISGSGNYDDIQQVDLSWELDAQQTGCISIHGHRNQGEPVFVSDHVINLDSDAYSGGNLRGIRINCNTGEIEDVSVKNDVFFIPAAEVSLDTEDMTAVIAAMRENRSINEKELGNNISSFNFTRKAFAQKNWDHQSVHARGLFIDTQANKVKARSYDKFFSVGERDETRLETLAKSFDYPVYAYVKENGYLGICSYNDDGSLFCASKTTTEGIYAERFRCLLENRLGDKVNDFSRYLKDHDLSAVFEVIDPEYDFHIIEYGRPSVVLLTCVRNQMKFEEVSYDNLTDIARQFGLDVKAKADVIKDAQELVDWYSRVKAYEYKFTGYDDYTDDGFGNLDGNNNDGYHVEGFVLTDSSGSMVKVKGDWYQFWKFFRRVAQDIARRGKSARIGADSYIASFANTPDMDEVYAFLKQHLNSRDKEKKQDEINIIELRKMWSDQAKH